MLLSFTTVEGTKELGRGFEVAGRSSLKPRESTYYHYTTKTPAPPWFAIIFVCCIAKNAAAHLSFKILYL